MLEKKKPENNYSKDRVVEILEMVLKYLLAMITIMSLSYCISKTNSSNPIYLTGKLEIVQPQEK